MHQQLSLLLLCASVTAGVSAETHPAVVWDGTQWPQPVQQAFVEALVWDHGSWHPGNKAATELATKQAEAHLERAFDLARQESPRCYAEVLTAAAACSLSSTRYISDFREAALGLIDSERKAATLRKAEGMLGGAGSEQARKLIEQMRKDSERQADSATESTLESMRVLLGEYSASHVQWCIAAIAADPTFLPAWEQLAIHAEGKTASMAREEWQRLVPDNATPLICEAHALVSADKFEKAVPVLERAAALTKLTYHVLTLPGAGPLTYPDLGVYVAAGVMGKPVPDSAINSIAGGSGVFGQSMGRSLRSLYYSFRVPTEEDVEAGEFTDLPAMSDEVRCRALWAVLRLCAIAADSGPPDPSETMWHRATLGAAMNELLRQNYPIDEEQVNSIRSILRDIHRPLRAAVDTIEALQPTDEEQRLRSEFDGSIDSHRIWRDAVLKSREEHKLVPLIDELLGR